MTPFVCRYSGRATLAAALFAALMLGACGDDGIHGHGGGSGSGSGDSGPATVDPDAIPSQDAADAAAEQVIDDTNADEEFDKLLKEVDADG